MRRWSTHSCWLLGFLGLVWGCSSESATPPAAVAGSGGSGASDGGVGGRGAGADGGGGGTGGHKDWNQYIPPEEMDRVIFRTNVQSFNSEYYALTYEGKIYLKPNVEATGQDGPWVELELPPELAGEVYQIAMDDRFLVAANPGRALWQMNWGLSLDPADFVWAEYRGLPFMMGPRNTLPENDVKWDYSVVSPEMDETFTDTAGNSWAVGDSTCAHMTVLKQGARWIAINDSWLPADFEYEICGPKRGAFQAVNMSTSGSTFFVMNQYGDMFTYIWDFDMGADNFFFQYAWDDQSGVPAPARQLPVAPWVMHPKIDGTITDVISMHKVGAGCVHRTMRVEGLDEDGNTGYYEKDITDLSSSAWVFHRTDQELFGNIIDNRPYDSSNEDLAAPEDFYFSRNMANLPNLSNTLPGGGLTDNDWAAELMTFNPYCSPTTLRIHLSSTDSMDLILHHVHSVRLDIRTTRGLDDDPWEFHGDIEVPDAIWNNLNSLSPKARDFISHYLGDEQHTWWWTIQAAIDGIQLSRSGYQWQFTP